MSIRIGTGRRYCRGSVWVSYRIPWWVLMLIWPFAIVYLEIRVAVRVTIWSVRQIVAWYHRIRRRLR
jgi:hypothetical protein